MAGLAFCLDNFIDLNGERGDDYNDDVEEDEDDDFVDNYTRHSKVNNNCISLKWK